MSLPKMLEPYLSFPGWLKARPEPRPTLDDFPIRSNEKLRFSDTDRNGHVSNAVFAVCCQNARMELLHDRSRVPLSIVAQFLIARLTLEFVKEMHWPGIVGIGTRVDRVGTSSVVLCQSLFLDRSCVANATSTVVLVDPSTKRATPFPPETAAALRTLAKGAQHTTPWSDGTGLTAIHGTAQE